LGAIKSGAGNWEKEEGCAVFNMQWTCFLIEFLVAKTEKGPSYGKTERGPS